MGQNATVWKKLYNWIPLLCFWSKPLNKNTREKNRFAWWFCRMQMNRKRLGDIHQVQKLSFTLERWLCSVQKVISSSVSEDEQYKKYWLYKHHNPFWLKRRSDNNQRAPNTQQAFSCSASTSLRLFLSVCFLCLDLSFLSQRVYMRRKRGKQQPWLGCHLQRSGRDTEAVLCSDNFFLCSRG